MKKLLKRVLSFIISCAMLGMTLPVAAVPVYPEDEGTILDVTAGNDRDYAGVETRLIRAMNVINPDYPIIVVGEIASTGDPNESRYDTFINLPIKNNFTIKWRARFDYGYIKIPANASGTLIIEDGAYISDDRRGIINNSPNVKIIVSGGVVASRSNTYPAIETCGDIDVTGGTIQSFEHHAVSLTGDAILNQTGGRILSNGTIAALSAANGTIANIKGGTVENNNAVRESTGYANAIRCMTGSIVAVEGGTVIGSAEVKEGGNFLVFSGTVDGRNTYAIKADTGANIEIRGGLVTASGARFETVTSVAASDKAGSVFELMAGTISHTGGGKTFNGKFRNIRITGGEVLSNIESGYQIVTDGEVSVSNALVKSTHPTGGGISASKVTVSTGASVIVGKAYALRAAPYAVTVSGGFVFAETDAVIDHASPTVTNNGVVLGFNRRADVTEYPEYTEADITILPSSATAIWRINDDDKNGIMYKASALAQETFYEIEGISLVDITNEVILTYSSESDEVVDEIEDLFDKFDTVKIIGKKIYFGDDIEIEIPSGKTLEWAAEGDTSYTNYPLLTISGAGTFVVSSGYIKNMIESRDAFNVSGTVRVNITGGGLYTNLGNAIENTGTGKITVTDAVISTASGTAIKSAGNVEINDTVIYSRNEVTVGTGGIVDATRVDLDSDSAIIAWGGDDNATYVINSTTDIYTSPMLSAYWNLVSGVSGISYSGGGLSGFIPVAEVTVTDPDAPTEPDEPDDPEPEPEPEPVSVTGVELTGLQTTVEVGETISLTATVSPENADNPYIYWSSSANTIATVSDGVVTGVSAGTVTITVTAVDGGFSDSLEITVTDTNPRYTSVTVSPSSVSVQKGGTYQFSAVVNGYNNPDQSVEWDVSDQNSFFTTIADDGTLTIYAEETSSSLTITAASTVDTTISGTATVTVTADAPLTPTATYPVTIDGGLPVSYAAGAEVSLTAPERAGYDFTGWTTSDISLSDATQEQITFNMPAAAVSLTTSYQIVSYNVTVTDGTASPTSGTRGTLITLTADVPEGMVFDYWTVTPTSVILLNTESAAFFLPGEDVSVTANFRIPTPDNPAPEPEPFVPYVPNAPSYPDSPPPAPPAPPTPPAPTYDPGDTEEFISNSEIISELIVTEEGVIIEAGVNDSGSVNSESTILAVIQAAKIAETNGDTSLTLQIPEGTRGISENTIQRLVEAAGGLEITLELTSVVEGDVVGGVTLPLSTATGQILTELAFDTRRTAQTEKFAAEKYNVEVLGSFETAQKGGWGAMATLSVSLSKLDITADSHTKLYALIYDTKSKKWYKAEADVVDGNVIIKTTRSGVVTIVADPVM